jgi:hypothetical protein
MMKTFTTLVKQAMRFEGWMSASNIATFEYFLQDQNKRGITGNMLEFGVYKGRSASVLLHALNSEEWLYGIDSSEHPEIKKLEKINTNFKWIRGKSEDLILSSELPAVEGPIRFSHHDASHTFHNLSTELSYIEKTLSEDGIVVLDDFGAPFYPQVIAATYSYLYTTNSNLEIFLIGDNKAYLCRKPHFDYYAQMVLDGLIPSLSNRGFDYCIGRTDNESFRAFAFRPKRGDDEPDRYGEHIWGDKYYQL